MVAGGGGAVAARRCAQDLEGYLTKQGGSIKTWKKRFMILKGPRLYYFKNEDDDEVQGVVELASDSSVKLGASRPRREARAGRQSARAWCVGVCFFCVLYVSVSVCCVSMCTLTIFRTRRADKVIEEEAHVFRGDRKAHVLHIRRRECRGRRLVRLVSLPRAHPRPCVRHLSAVYRCGGSLIIVACSLSAGCDR